MPLGRQFVIVGSIVVLTIGAAALSIGGYFHLFGSGWSRQDTIRILVRDRKFGMRAVEKAAAYGNQTLPMLRDESDDFAALDGRNSFWIAEVLGRIQTSESRSLARHLLEREAPLSFLVGAVALAWQGTLDPDVSRKLIAIVNNSQDADQIQLAALALGKSKFVEAGPSLVGRLRSGDDYWTSAVVCEAIARIHYLDAIPQLRLSLSSNRFVAKPFAFRALIALGDKDAVPLAIALLDERSGAGLPYPESLMTEVEKVSGKHLGKDSSAWRRWWGTSGPSWSLPPLYQKPYDDQPAVGIRD